MRNLELNTSSKHHIWVAVLLGVWLVTFLVLIAPFDTSDLSFSIRLQILPPYGLIAFGGYMLLIPLQNWIYKQSRKWNIPLEITFLLLFNLAVLLGSFGYYKTDIINGTYDFSKFTFEVYYPIFFIILPVLLFLRWWLYKKYESQNQSKIVLEGVNKLDVLRIGLKDLVCISSADNYVEVSYLNKNELKKKLLRVTLKNIHPQVPTLLKVHRSHLINPEHFKAWKNTNTIYLTQTEVPVSKSYKEKVLAIHNHSSQKPISSPQTR